MSRRGEQARGVAGLVASLFVVVVALLLAPGVEAMSAADPGYCSTTSSVGDPCTPDPILTTSTSLLTTTTVELATSTSRATTSTTERRATPTTSRTQTSGAITTTSTTAPEPARLLVPGDGTEGAENTTTTEASVTRFGRGGPSDGTLIALVVAGLTLIAVLVGILTWRYWVATRPPLRDPDRASPAAG